MPTIIDAAMSLESSIGRCDKSPIVAVFDPWNRHLGLLWARMLRQQRIRLDGRVVELGPGFSAKIGHGLAEVGFQGVAVLIEPNDDARRSAASKYLQLQGESSLGAIHEIGLTALRLLARRLEHDLSRPVCLRQLGDQDMYWLISVDPDLAKHPRMRS